MAKLWQYLIPIPLGFMEDQEATQQATYDTLHKAYIDLEARYASVARDRSNMAQEMFALRATLVGDSESRQIIGEQKTRIENLQFDLDRRDALLRDTLDKVQALKGPISNQTKELIVRPILAVLSSTPVPEQPQPTEDSDGTLA